MEAFVIIAAFAFGTIIGSFLLVVADRHNTGRTLGGRSFCFSCGATLSWWELFPLVSFFFQKGRCHTCRGRLSVTHPLVESVSGVLAALVAWKFLWLLPVFPFAFFGASLLYFSVWATLIVITVYDSRHMIIPDRFVFLFILLAIASRFIDPGTSSFFAVPGIMEFIHPLFLALPFAVLWFSSRGRLFGFGDVKLMIGMGFFLGLAGGIAAVLIGFWAGAVGSAILLLLKKGRFTMKSEIPFAPFLIFGTLVAFAFDADIWTILGLLAF